LSDKDNTLAEEPIATALTEQEVAVAPIAIVPNPLETVSFPMLTEFVLAFGPPALYPTDTIPGQNPQAKAPIAIEPVSFILAWCPIATPKGPFPKVVAPIAIEHSADCESDPIAIALGLFPPTV
jgi:hypothetical protein